MSRKNSMKEKPMDGSISPLNESVNRGNLKLFCMARLTCLFLFDT